MADTSAFFTFGTNIEETAERVAVGVEKIIASTEGLASKVNRMNAGGPNAGAGNQYLDQIKNLGSNVTEGSLQSLKAISDQFKQAAAGGSTKVNGQTLQKALKALSVETNDYVLSEVRGLVVSKPAGITDAESGKLITAALTTAQEAISLAVKKMIADTNSIAREVGGLKGQPFGTHGLGSTGLGELASAPGVLDAQTRQPISLIRNAPAASLNGEAAAAQDVIDGDKVLADAQRKAARAAIEMADSLAAGINSGKTVKIAGNTLADSATGKFYQTSTDRKTGQSSATEINDPLQLATAQQQFLSTMQRRNASSRKAAAQEEAFVGEEKTAYDEFLKGFFGAGGRKRTGGASNIDASNPLAGFAETAGIVAKYELQGRAIQSLSGSMAGAVKDYGDLNQATRLYNDVTGDANAATASYASSLENMAAVAGGNVVEAMASATRGVIAFSSSQDSVKQKQQTGSEFVGAATQYGVITGQNQKDSTDQLIAAGKGFGIGADSLGRVTNAIANAKESFGSDSAAVGEAMGELGSTAKTAGFTLEEFAQILGKVQATTGDSGGTLTSNIGRILDQFQTGAGKGALASVGVSVTGNAKDEILSLAKVYPTLNTAQQQFINTQLGGARALRDLIPILSDSKGLQDAFTKALDDGGAANREYNASVGSIAGQLKQMSTLLKNVGLDLARSGILTPLGAILEAFKLLITFVDRGIQALDSIAGPFKAFGINAKDAAISVLEVVAVLKLLSAAKARLATGEAGGGLTGVTARTIGFQRVRKGRNIETNEQLSPAEADAQRQENGIRPKQAAEQKATAATTELADANTAAATTISGATDVRIAAEERLIAIINESIIARGGESAATIAETQAALAAAAAMVTLTGEEIDVSYADNLAATSAIELAAAQRDAVIAASVARDATLRGQIAGATAGVRGLAGSAAGAVGGLGSRAIGSRFVGGGGGLVTAGIIAAVGYGAIQATRQGTDAQLAAQGKLSNLASTTTANTNPDDLRAAATKLSGASQDLSKSSSGLRGFATQAVGALLGGESGGAGRKTADYEAKGLNELAAALEDLSKTTATTGLVTLVSLKSLDALNTTLTNLQNTGASNIAIFSALELGLRHFGEAATGGVLTLSGASKAAVAATVGFKARQEISTIHDNTVVGNSYLGRSDQTGLNVDADPGWSAKGIRKHTSGGVNAAAQKTVTDTINAYFAANPTGVNEKELLPLLTTALGKTPGLTGKDADTQAIIRDVALQAAVDAKRTYANYQGKGAAQIAPGDIGKQVANILATSSGAAQDAQNLLALGQALPGLSPSDSDVNKINQLQDNVNAAANNYKKAAALAKEPGAGFLATVSASNALAAVGAAQKAKDDYVAAVGKKDDYGPGTKNDQSGVPAALGAANYKLAGDQAVLKDAQGVIDGGTTQKAVTKAANKLAADSALKADPKTIKSDQAALKKAQDAENLADTNLGQALAVVSADKVAVQAAMLAWISQQATNASNTEVVTDKIAQESDAISGLSGQIAYLQKNGGDKTVIAGLIAQRHAAQQQQQLDIVGVANSAAQAQLLPGDTLAASTSAVATTGATFDKVAALEKDLPKHSQTYWDDYKAHQDAIYQNGLDAVNAQGAQLLAALDPRDVVGTLAQTFANLQSQIDKTNDPGQKAQLLAQQKQTYQQQLEAQVAQNSAIRTTAVDPRDVVGRAVVDVTNAADELSIQKQGTKAYADALDQLNQKKIALAQDENAQASAMESASVFPGDPVGAAKLAVDTTRRTLATDLVGSTQYFTDLATLKADIYAYAATLRDAALESTKLHQDLTNPVVIAQDAVTAAKNKLAGDKYIGAPKAVINADQNTLRQAVSSEEDASFQQKFGFLQTDQQLYRITIPQYLQGLRNLRASITGTSIQAINERNQIDQAILAAEQTASGSFNIGDIKLPTLYEARRQGILAGQVTQAGLANAGQQAINTGESFNNIFQPITDALGNIQTRGAVLQLTTLQSAISAIGVTPGTAAGSTVTNHINISGADLVKIIAYLNSALGVAATSTRTASSTRKV